MMGEDAVVPLSTTGDMASIASESTVVASGVDVRPIVNPSCRCLDSSYQSGGGVTLQLDVLQTSHLSSVTSVELQSATGFPLWIARVEQLVRVGLWTTLRIRANARSANVWGGASGWDGTPPWDSIRVVVLRRTLYGVPSIAEVPVVRNLRLESAQVAGEPLAAYLRVSAVQVAPTAVNSFVATNIPVSWRSLDDYDACIFAPQCDEVNMTAYFANITADFHASQPPEPEEPEEPEEAVEVNTEVRWV